MIIRMGRWSAARWEREQWLDFSRWRSASGGIAEWQLRTLLDSVRWTVFGPTAEFNALKEVAQRLDDVVTRCNELEFENWFETAAYSLIHLADRYDRAGQVLEQLMQAGYLPLRQKSLRVLDVGSGPAPNLYATTDFYAGINRWVEHSEQNISFSQAIMLESIDRGPAWGQLTHFLSERLIDERRDSPTHGYAYPFHVSYHNFAGFSPRKERQEAFHNAVHMIIQDYDGEISQPYARQLAADSQPRSSYDLIFISNFLTQPSTVDTFELELRELSDSLSLGGIIIFTGSAGKQYEQVWERIELNMITTRLHRMECFSQPLSTADSAYARAVREHTRTSLECLRAAGLPVNKRFDRISYPSFRVMAWKNGKGESPVDAL